MQAPSPALPPSREVSATAPGATTGSEREPGGPFPEPAGLETAPSSTEPASVKPAPALAALPPQPARMAAHPSIHPIVCMTRHSDDFATDVRTKDAGRRNYYLLEANTSVYTVEVRPRAEEELAVPTRSRAERTPADLPVDSLSLDAQPAEGQDVSPSRDHHGGRGPRRAAAPGPPPRAPPSPLHAPPQRHPVGLHQLRDALPVHVRDDELPHLVVDRAVEAPRLHALGLPVVVLGG